MAGRPRAPNKKWYLQFSKWIIIAITIAVTGICVDGINKCAAAGDTGGVVDIVEKYINYATIAFVAYSGNSAAEKWLLKKYKADEDASE